MEGADEESLKRIHSVPYIRGIPEFAAEVRDAYRRLKGKDFIVAVDLPHGLETDVLKAVKRLPKPTLLLDPLRRGILVIPSCAAIEAVRSFLEEGTEYRFVDTSLPVSATTGEWRRLAEYCKEFGQEDVFARAEEYGIDLPSMVISRQEPPPERPFLHVAGRIGSTLYSDFLPSVLPEYYEARQRMMAMHLRDLLSEEMEILFVCSQRHWGRVMKFVREPINPFEDPVRLPVVPCRLRAEDLPKVSPEIPWFVGLYERWRTEGFSRRDAIIDLLTGVGENRVVGIETIYTYSMNLALSKAQLYPDLFSLVQASQLCAGDDFAWSVFQRANLYPYDNDGSNCKLREFMTWDFENPGGKVITLHPSRLSAVWNRDREGAVRIPPIPWSTVHFTRTSGSKAAEREFMRYLERRYVSRKPVDIWRVEEFSTGLKDGIDCRETLRPHQVQVLYVRDQALVNSAAYVVDFGGNPTWRVYFDTQYPLVGGARREGDDSHTWVCFVAFPAPPRPMEQLLEDIDLRDLRTSCIGLALANVQHVFLFTDTRSRPPNASECDPRVKVIDIRAIPAGIGEQMRWFHVER